jgi:putative NADH-flavin reductase
MNMRVLLLGATGNLGTRLLPALLAHGHTVVAFVRSKDKLRSLITPKLYDTITVITGDALDTDAVEAALLEHNCGALVQTSGNSKPTDLLGRLATSISSAAIRVGKQRRGPPLRAWFIGGLGSLTYPGTGGYQLQDYLPRLASAHHRPTEEVLKAIPTSDLDWSLLCVAIMTPTSDLVDVLEQPRGNGLVVSKGELAAYQPHWVTRVPVVGKYLDVFAQIFAYTTKLEDVADLIANDLAQKGRSEYVGELVGMKDVGDDLQSQQVARSITWDVLMGRRSDGHRDVVQR